VREDLSKNRNGHNSDTDLADKGLVQEVHILYSLLPATQWIDIAAVALVFGLLIKYVDITSLVAWSIFAVVIVTARISIRERYSTAAVTTANVKTWLNWFLTGAILYGIMWSETAILLVPSDIPTAAAFTALILCGLTAAGVAVSSVNLKVFTVYTLATLWPYSFFLMASGQSPQTIIGGLMFLFSFVIFAMGLRTYHFFRNMVRLELQSSKLQEELKYEIRKRQLAESALLDNTLAEELADRIRQQSLALKDGAIRIPTGASSLQIDHTSYLTLLNTKFREQLQNVLVFIRDLENAALSENLKKEVHVISKILNNMMVIITKTTADNNHVKQVIDIFDTETSDTRPINIRRMVNYLVQALPMVYKAKFITINRNIDNNVPATVYGNKEALERILSCLINNAVKYSDGGTVNLNIQTVSGSGDLVELRFSVADTGRGMTRDIVNFLAEERQDENLERFPGLAVVKHLVGRHGNNMSVKSTPGAGTEIAFHMQFKAEHMLSASKEYTSQLL